MIGILAAVIYIFAIIGCEIFSTSFTPVYGDVFANYETMGQALTLGFQMISGQNLNSTSLSSVVGSVDACSSCKCE